MKTSIATICLLLCLLLAAPAAADEVGWPGQWLDRIFGEMTVLFDAVGGALVPTGEPTAESTEENGDPDAPKVPLVGEEPDASGNGGTLD